LVTWVVASLPGGCHSIGYIAEHTGCRQLNCVLTANNNVVKSGGIQPPSLQGAAQLRVRAVRGHRGAQPPAGVGGVPQLRLDARGGGAVYKLNPVMTRSLSVRGLFVSGACGAWFPTLAAYQVRNWFQAFVFHMGQLVPPTSRCCPSWPTRRGRGARAAAAKASQASGPTTTRWRCPPATSSCASSWPCSRAGINRC
jgi:hypothetical protein